MGFLSWSNFAFLYVFYALVFITNVSSRHIHDSDSENEQDPSKSGKPGEYLWYMTSSDSRVAKSSVPKTVHDFELNEDSGEGSSLNGNSISGSGEPSGESSREGIESYSLSGSGSYPTSYMIDVSDDTGTGQGQDKSKKNVREDNRDKEVESSTELKTNEGDSSGSGNNEEGSSLAHYSTQDVKSNGNEGNVKIVTPTIEEMKNSLRRSEISRKKKVERLKEDGEYDDLFKDFGTEGDLGPGLDDDDSDDLDDSLSEEEAKLLIPKEDEEDDGKSKSEIGRPDQVKKELSPTFRGFLHVESTKHKKNSKHVQSRTSNVKEILSKLDIDVFKGNQSNEHVEDQRAKHAKLDVSQHEKANESKEADASRALSHHADSGIFNGSVSGVTLEAEKVKKRPIHHHHHHHHHRHKPHPHKRHRQHHDYHHRHHHVHKATFKLHPHQPDSDVQYSPQVQSPPVHNPYPHLYPPLQAQPTTYQPSSPSTSEYVYHPLQNADREGAVCLDGSVPGYYLKQGSGTGINKWIIYLQGGAWCDTKETCVFRTRMHLGSSLFFKPILNPGGLLSSSEKDNPKFYNWNVAFLPYCDGSSFSGNRSDPVEFQGSLLYFRGFRILDSTISALLLQTSLKDSKHVVFSGTSAGGLAVMLHADFVRSKLEKNVHFRALADSGFFLDTSSRKRMGQHKFRNEMQNVFKLHDCTDGVPQKCVDKMPGKDLWKCIFPQYFLSFVKSKVFIVNPLYDSWQLKHIWEIDCASNPYSCSKEEVKQIKKFRKTTLKAMIPLFKKSNFGLFADSCVDHGQVVYNNRWNAITVRKTNTISSSFVKWLQNKRKYFVDEDDYPANPTCVTIGVDKRSDILTEGF